MTSATSAGAEEHRAARRVGNERGQQVMRHHDPLGFEAPPDLEAVRRDAKLLLGLAERRPQQGVVLRIVATARSEI